MKKKETSFVINGKISDFIFKEDRIGMIIETGIGNDFKIDTILETTNCPLVFISKLLEYKGKETVVEMEYKDKELKEIFVYVRDNGEYKSLADLLLESFIYLETKDEIGKKNFDKKVRKLRKMIFSGENN